MNLKEKLGLCWRIIKQKPGGLVSHAQRELPPADDEMQALMNGQLIELLTVFSTHGHSGFSGAYACAVLTKLLAFEPLRPLTGEDSEWMEVGDGYSQNTRCGRVFKRHDEPPYDSEAVTFEEPNGCRFGCFQSRRHITFPYIPRTVIAKVPFDSDEQTREAAAVAALTAAT